MKVWTNHTDTVVAADLADVRAVVEEHYGHTLESEGWSLDDWGEVPGDKSLTIHDWLDHHGEFMIETRTAAQWALDEGRGFLCSTEY